MSSISTPFSPFSGDPTGAAAIFAGTKSEGDPSFVITRLNSLLRGEIAASETYRNVLDHAATSSNTEHLDLLQGMHAEHTKSCGYLRDRVTELGGEPTTSSGAWGLWAEIVQGTLSLFGGNMGGIRALLEGEQHGLNDYEAAINDVDPASAQLIQNQLLPAQQKHLAVLQSILDKAANK